ncbi:MAG: hypothetical protein RKE49_08335 [Oceanicaulis sp.]
MRRTSAKNPKPGTISLGARLAVGAVAAALAGTAAHVFLGDPITTGVAALFFGLGAAVSLGQGNRGGVGGDGGGGFGDGGGDGGGG